MEFNQLISDRLGMILQNHNLFIIEQFRNCMKFKSDNVVIKLCHDDRENSNALYVGRNEHTLFPINEYVLRSVFNSDLKINYVTQEIFVNNLAVFFKREGNPILKGNLHVLEAIEKVVRREGEAYTTQLINEQNIEAANKFWEEGNYEEFIKILDKIDRQKLPVSYELKYKMARQKLN